MVDDHTKLRDQMKQVAAHLGVRVPNGPSKKDREVYNKLNGLDGAAFDKAYIDVMVEGSQEGRRDVQTGR